MRVQAPKDFVACPRVECQAVNFSGFRFCQCCGQQREVITLTGNAEIDEKAIERRKGALFALVNKKAHERSKKKEVAWFADFLLSRASDAKRKQSVFEASPEDVVDFLVHRCMHSNSRTVVHDKSCTVRESSCDCPSRMGHSATAALASKLRTRLTELGCSGPWSAQTSAGNPADSALVNKYVNAVKEEQGRAGVVAISARHRAMMPDKLEVLIERMRNRAYDLYLSNKPEYIRLLQDIAWITIQFRSLNRGNELENLRSQEAIIGPNNSCLAFQVSFSKTLRGGSNTHEFGVAAQPGSHACPVRAFRTYVEETKKLQGWIWERGSFPVFPYINRDGTRGNSSVTAGADRKSVV